MLSKFTYDDVIDVVLERREVGCQPLFIALLEREGERGKMGYKTL